MHFSSISVQCLLLNLVLIMSHNGSFLVPLSFFFLYFILVSFFFCRRCDGNYWMKNSQTFCLQLFFFLLLPEEQTILSGPDGCSAAVCMASELSHGLLIKWSLGSRRRHTNGREESRLEDLDKKGKLLLRRRRAETHTGHVYHFPTQFSLARWNASSRRSLSPVETELSLNILQN